MPYAQLPLLASRLNVDADRLAGDYHGDHGARRPFAFMAPNTGAFLVTDDGTLTSNFSSKLRSRSTSPGLEEYIRTKNKWDYYFRTTSQLGHSRKSIKSVPDQKGASYKIPSRRPSDVPSSQPNGRRHTEMYSLRKLRRDDRPHLQVRGPISSGRMEAALVANGG